jgi:hypothetical protein
MRCGLALAVALAAAPVAAEEPYLDDRSTPEAVVRSLYNAIGRQEYLRAWSYFADGAVAPYPAYRDGFAETAAVRVKVGAGEAEGTAGTTFTSLPVAVEATGTDGKVAVYAGCYVIAQLQPAVQDAPPFRPIQIREAQLAAVTETFDAAEGRCP